MDSPPQLSKRGPEIQMKSGHDDPLIKALALLSRSVLSDDGASKRSLSPVSGDIGEMFLAELQARRERLKNWLRLLKEEARVTGESGLVARGSRYKCRGPAVSRRRRSAAD